MNRKVSMSLIMLLVSPMIILAQEQGSQDKQAQLEAYYFDVNNGGEIVRAELVHTDKNWVEKQKGKIVFNWTEYSRDNDYIYLQDTTRGFRLAIPLGGGISKISASLQGEWQNWNQMNKGTPPTEQSATSQEPSTEGNKAQESEVDRLIRMGDKYYFAEGVAKDLSLAQDSYKQAIRAEGDDYRAHLGLGAVLYDAFLEKFGETDNVRYLKRLVRDATNQFMLGLSSMLYRREKDKRDEERFYLTMGSLKNLMERFDEEEIGQENFDFVRYLFDKYRKLASERWGIEY